MADTSRPSLRTCACTHVRMPGALVTAPAWVFGVAACVQAITASVTIFGWSNLVVSLIDDGVFSSECAVGDELPCDAQSSKLNLMFVIGSALTLASSLLVNGWVMDLYGVKVASLVAVACLVVAYSMMAAAAADSTQEDLYFGGFSFLGLGQTGLLHPLFSLSNLFPGYESLVIGIINGCADSAVVVFLAFRQLYESGSSLEDIFLVYMAGPLVLATITVVVLWPWRPVPPGGEGVLLLEPQVPEDKTTADDDEPSATAAAVVVSDTTEDVEAGEGLGLSSADSGEEEGAAAPPAVFDPVYPYATSPFWEQLCSPLYVGLACFNIISLVKFSWYLSMIGDHLTFLGQEDGQYTTILGSVLPVGVVFVLVVGGTIDRFGMHVAIASNFGASLILSVVTLIPNLPLQVVGFIIFAFFRAGLFTILTAILGKEFGFTTFGRLIGVLSVGSALLGLVNQPLFDWSLSSFDGDFTTVNALYGAATLLQGLFVVYYWRYRGVANGEGHDTAFTWWHSAEGVKEEPALPEHDTPVVGDGAGTELTALPSVEAEGEEVASEQPPAAEEGEGAEEQDGVVVEDIEPAVEQGEADVPTTADEGEVPAAAPASSEDGSAAEQEA